MGMDIRLPIGLMFSVLGVLLTVFGAFSRREIYRVSLGINMNLAWGLVLLAFGVVMLLFVYAANKSERLHETKAASEVARSKE